MTLSAAEQLLIEMINRARLDPAGEAARFGVDLNAGLAAGTLDGAARQVLAPNQLLHDAAEAHSDWMLATDTFSHSGAGGSSPGDRMADAGYDFTGRYASGENITYRGSTGTIDADALMEEHHHRDLFLSAGHRVNMLHDFYSEIGVSQQTGVFTSRGTDFNAAMVTENFALSGTDVFLTGVIYADRDGDEFYSIGEGQAGTTIAAAGQSQRSAAAGGYAIAAAPSAAVSVSLGSVALTVDLSGGNGKLDLVDGSHVRTSVDTVLQGAAGSLTALGVGDIDLTGHAGADVLEGNAGDNRIDGRGGTDTVRYALERAEVQLSEDAEGNLRVSSALGVDTLINVERLAFDDGAVEVSALFGGAAPDPDPVPAPDPAPTPAPAPAPAPDPQTETDTASGGAVPLLMTGTAGDDALYAAGFAAAYTPEISAQVYRLYLAALGREADAAGHAQWTEALAEGLSELGDVAAAFVGSAEFRASYGDLDAGAFVDLLYRNVLDRAADAAGHAQWREALESGGITRAGALAGFSESAEFVAATSSAAASFTAARDQGGWSDDVFRLYQATLDRAPDAGGLAGWTGRLAEGSDFAAVVRGFVNSEEFTRTYGDLDDAGFVDLLYRNVLGRAGDAQGMQGWIARLEGGASRAEVVTGFAQSPEFAAATAAPLAAWMRAQGVQTRLEGGAGDDLMTGGAMPDAFVFAAGQAGHDRVLGLDAWDSVHFEGFGYADADAVRMHLSQQDGDVVFAHGAVQVTFEDVDLTLFTDAMIEV